MSILIVSGGLILNTWNFLHHEFTLIKRITRIVMNTIYINPPPKSLPTRRDFAGSTSRGGIITVTSR